MTDPQDALYRVTRLARLLDARFRVPGTPMVVGLDGLVGLIPGVGDTVGLALSGYIVVEAWRAGVRHRVLARMAANVAIDYVIGLVPILGDLFDFAWKANLRNVQLMADELDRLKGRQASPSRRASVSD